MNCPHVPLHRRSANASRVAAAAPVRSRPDRGASKKITTIKTT